MLNSRRAAKVIVKCLKLKAFAPVPCSQFVWTCADRLFVKVMAAFN